MNKVLMVFTLTFGLIATIFAHGQKETASSGSDISISMFHNKVEIKDAIDTYAALYSNETMNVNISVETYGGGNDYYGALKTKAQADNLPDIFMVEGLGTYEIWKDYIADLSDQPWVSDTDLGLTVQNKVFGFPVAIEGYGLAYNAEILEKAGIDPKSLTTRDAYEVAFKILDTKKVELGINAPVSMAASVAGNMWWVAGQHNLACYWGGDLDFNDTSVIDAALKGEVDESRLIEYAKYVQLLFNYSDQNILLNGSYDSQVGSFAQGKTAFLHQGNWVDPNMAQLGVTFKMGYAPHAFTNTEQKGLYLFAPSYYVVNKMSSNAEAAKEFLASLVSTPAGQNYMVNEAGMIPAFKSVTQKPDGQLSIALMEANVRGGNYGVFFAMLPDGAGQNVFGPIYDLFAQNPDDLDQFVSDMKVAIANLPNM